MVLSNVSCEAFSSEIKHFSTTTNQDILALEWGKDSCKDFLAYGTDERLGIMHFTKTHPLKEVFSNYVTSRVMAISWSPSSIFGENSLNYTIAVACVDMVIRICRKSSVEELRGFKDYINDVTFCGTDFVVSVSDDELLWIYSLDKKTSESVRLPSRGKTVMVNNDYDDCVLVLLENGALRVLNIFTKETVLQFSTHAELLSGCWRGSLIGGISIDEWHVAKVGEPYNYHSGQLTFNGPSHGRCSFIFSSDASKWVAFRGNHCVLYKGNKKESDIFSEFGRLNSISWNSENDILVGSSGANLLFWMF
jgi:hypothetical protein